MEKERICGTIGLILSLPIAVLTFSSGALCCFNTTFWSVGNGTLFIVMPLLIALFSIIGFVGSFLNNRYPLFSGIMMLIAVAGLLIISPFILLLASLFFLLGGLISVSKIVKKQGKFKLKQAITIIGSIIVVMLLFLGIFYFISPGPYQSKLLYKVSDWVGDIWGGGIDFKGDYVAWLQYEEEYKNKTQYLCILNISNVNNPALIYKERTMAYRTTIPFILDDAVIWAVNSSWYFYNISTDTKHAFNLSDGISVDAHLVMKEDGGLNLYNLYNGSRMHLNVSPLCYAIYGNYVVWEQEDPSYQRQINCSLWLYNISSNETRQLVSNITLNNDRGASVDIYESTVVFSDGFSIYTYNVSTSEKSFLSEHSRKGIRNGVSQYFSNIQIYGDNVIYVEISNEIVGLDDYHQFFSYWVVHIPTNKKVELKTAYCINQDKVVGITIPSTGDGLYLVDLKELF